MRRSTVQVGPGSIIKVSDRTFVVRAWDSASTVIARDLATMTDLPISLSDITASLGTSQNGEQIDLSCVSDKDWDLVSERYRLLHPLVEDGNRGSEAIMETAQKLGIGVSSVYRLLAKIKEVGTVTCLLRKRRVDRGTKKIDEGTEKIIREVVLNHYLTPVKPTPAWIHREISRLCRKQGLDVPSHATVRRRIEEIAPEERARRREGRNAALKLRHHRGTLPGVNHVHAIWQIDHTKVDIILVDEQDRIPIGRPWITVAIEVFSRMVVGWYISFDPPGTLATGICISTAILPKEPLLAKLGITHSWPCQGKPHAIHADNAKEFRGNTLKMACNEHGIDLTFRKVKKPNYGAHIERLLGTLAREIHHLEGTTFSNPQARGDYKSASGASMTLREFETWLATLILGLYHQRPHSELGVSPLKRYNEGVFGNDQIPAIGSLAIAADPEKLRIDFLPMEQRTIQPYGVVMDRIEYHSPVLDKWIGSSQPGSKRTPRKFVFRRDPRDISKLIFWDPDAYQYYEIPYRDSRRPAISLWELREIQAFLAARGKEEIDEEAIFNALDEMRRIEETAKSLTRSQRLNQERRKRHRATTQPALSSPPVPESPLPPLQPNSPSNSHFDLGALQPFDEIEKP